MGAGYLQRKRRQPDVCYNAKRRKLSSLIQADSAPVFVADFFILYYNTIMSNDKSFSINITTSTIIKFFLVMILIYFFYIIKDILIILFISLIFSSALDPFVDWMQERKIPRSVGILLIYVILLITISLTIYLIIPPIAQEIGDLSANSPRYAERILSEISSFKQYSIEHGIIDEIKSGLGSVSQNLQKAASGVFTTVTSIFGGIISFFLVLVITFYMVVEENAIKKLVWSLAPEKHQAYIMHLINRMQKKVGLWLRGQLLLSLLIFILTYIGLSILDVQYALVLAIIAGFTEFVPYVGPILGAVPAIFLAFTQSPTLAIFTAALYFVIQQTENHILVPKVMEKTVGLNPIISISVLLIGYKVAGVAGAILSIPVATAISVLVKDFFDEKDIREKQ